MQEFVLETQEQFPRKCMFSVFGEDRLREFNIQVGEVVTVSFDIDAREYNGRWYNDIRAWRVQRGVVPAPGVAAPVTPAGVPAPTAPVAAPAPAAPAAAAPAAPTACHRDRHCQPFFLRIKEWHFSFATRKNASTTQVI